MTADGAESLHLLIEGLNPQPGCKLRVWVGGHDRVAKQALLSVLRDAGETSLAVLFPPVGALDAVFVVAESLEEGAYFACKLQPRLEAGGSLCLIIPMTTSELAGDLPPAVATPEHSLFLCSEPRASARADSPVRRRIRQIRNRYTKTESALMKELASKGFPAEATHIHYVLGTSHLALVYS